MLNHASRAVALAVPTTTAARTAARTMSSSSLAVAHRHRRGAYATTALLVGELGVALSQSRAMNDAPPPRQRHYCYSTSVSSRESWAAVTSPRKSTVAPSHLRQRRPIVNGEAVAFHVNDLASRNPNNNSASRASLLGGSSSNRFSPPSPLAAASAPMMSSMDSSGNDNNNNGDTRRRYESDMVVVLDMDECLIHSKFLSPQNAQFFAYQLLMRQNRSHRDANPTSPPVDGTVPPSSPLGNSNNNHSTRRLDTIRFTLPDGDLVHVNLRPGLAEFLKAVSAKYETHIFTASMSVYADPLLDQLDPTGTMISGRWYREHCTYQASQQAYVKDLDRLPFKELGRVVLVDNNPLSFLSHPNNGILVSSFYNDPNDNSLQSVWNLLQELDRQPDVRPHLEQRFGIKKALAQLPANHNSNSSLNGFRSAAIRPTATEAVAAA